MRGDAAEQQAYWDDGYARGRAEAANEIERLRSVLDTIVGMCLGHREIGKIHALAVKTLRNGEQEPKR